MSHQPRGKLLTHGHGDEELDGEVDEEVPPQGGEAASWRGGEAAPAWRSLVEGGSPRGGGLLDLLLPW